MPKHASKSAEIIEFFKANPTAKVPAVAKRFQVHYVTALRARKASGAAPAGGGRRGRRRRGRPSASPGRPRGRPRMPARGDGDRALVNRLREEHEALGRMIELLENPTARDVLDRVIRTR